jgi:hypothetical protein
MHAIRGAARNEFAWRELARRRHAQHKLVWLRCLLLQDGTIALNR